MERIDIPSGNITIYNSITLEPVQVVKKTEKKKIFIKRKQIGKE